jgi:glycosyltransferase involved in cell wall biosynthesis
VRVVHFITTLAVGGAEQMLVKLLRAMDRGEFEPTVVTLVNDGALIEVVRDMGIEVQSLDLRRGEVSPRALRRLVTILRGTRPDLVQSWMYHSNVAASLARPWLPRRTGIVWNIRQSLYDITKERYLTQAVIRSGRVLAPHADAMVNNSRVSSAQHARIGYVNRRSLVIPNGFEVASFKPDPAARASFRAELGVADDAIVAGIVARVHPSKDHALFFIRWRKLAADSPESTAQISLRLKVAALEVDSKVQGILEKGKETRPAVLQARQRHRPKLPIRKFHGAQTSLQLRGHFLPVKRNMLARRIAEAQFDEATETRALLNRTGGSAIR